MRTLTLFSMILRLVLAILCSGLLGLEREFKRHPAGLRTYMLVCVGSSLVMMTNQYLTQFYGGGDAARLGAQVISGIGFLGAGTIIVDREQHVRGLTTAAGLWANACIGLAIGVGFYEGAVIACALTFIIMSVFNKLEHRLRRASASVVEVYAEFRSQSGLQIYLGELAGKNMSTISIERVDPKRESSMPSCVAVQMSVRLSSRDDRRLAMQTLCQFDDLYYLEELRGHG